MRNSTFLFMKIKMTPGNLSNVFYDRALFATSFAAFFYNGSSH